MILSLLVPQISAFRGGSVSAVPFNGKFLVKIRQILPQGQCGPAEVDKLGDICIREEAKIFNQVNFELLADKGTQNKGFSNFPLFDIKI